MHLFSNRSGGDSSTTGTADHEPTLGNLLRQLYLLRTYGQREVNGCLELVPSHTKDEEDRQLLGQILECKGYANSPSEVERDLIGYFRWQHGLHRNDWAPVSSFILTGNPDRRAQWLIPNWILAKREHVFYAKPGAGKTILGIHMAHAITGDPEISEFLDSGPFSGHDRWRKSRVLFIGTDMYDSAEEMTETYIQDLGLSNMDFLNYIDWWFEDVKRCTPGWTLSLRHLLQLHDHLKSNREVGTPVTAVVVDSMKAVCPDHLLVGQQAFKDYLRLVYDICSLYDAALIWIHHAHANNGGAQGIQRITEGAAAVIKMESDPKDKKRVILNVEKLRGGRSREMTINPFTPGAPTLLPDPEDGADDQDRPVLTNQEIRRREIHDLLLRDLSRYRRENPNLSGAQLALIYKGMLPAEIAESMPSISKATLRRDLTDLVDEGWIERRGQTSNLSYRVRLEDDGEQGLPFDAFTAGG